ncbi:T9SS type A sorting domain-containing protein [Dyadobacter sandarakinus]|uniref:T9SS type A sorting domain-containing protein n=1 Tax=Dyadobacter sandarakinus TaxID=2747268 RepID=A0ABX7I9D2_9BACT|nr:T9SS type A sorting domain-containing protein [Dyadobacter sandarakinus]QRR02423.1 T9SS type A sorting domain-containing protein [Dyadobacter sandarakinus]
MKATLLVLTLLSWAGMLSAQCPDRDIVLETQSAVNNFSTTYPGCTALKASLVIREDDISNLQGLQGITSIAGDLAINDNATLPNLLGLETLQTIGGSLYTYNTALTNLSGLENLTAIGMDLTVNTSPRLTTLAALKNLRSIGRNIDLYDLGLINLDGLENITSVKGSVFLNTLHELTSIQGFASLGDIDGSLSILGVSKLEDLAGLEKLDSIGSTIPGPSIYQGSLTIMDAPVTGLQGLKSLVFVAQDLIFNQTALPDLKGLDSLSTLLGSLDLTKNALLENVNGLEQLSSIGENLTLTQNPLLSNLTGLKNLVSIGARNQGLVSRFLTITENPQLATCSLLPVCNYQQEQGEDFMLIEGNAPGCASYNDVYYACLALPVTLQNFDAAAREEHVLLQWTTVSEINTKQFEVQHSLDAKSWKKLGIVSAQGKSSVVQKYSFSHEQPLPGSNMYRLKMVDLDGSFAYSSIANVHFKPSVQLVVFPNPVSSKLFMHGINHSEVREVELYTQAGKLIHRGAYDHQKGINVENLSGGLHFARVVLANGQVVSARIHKEKGAGNH